MRLCARALETRRAVVDPPTRPLARIRRRALRKAIDGPLERSAATPWPRRAKGGKPQAIRAIVWTRKCPVRTPGKIDKPLWAPTFGGPAETKKARSVVASSRVPRWAGFAGSPPAAGLPRTVNWPLVQIPADRHTTTGTCVLGKITIWANRASAQEFSSAQVNNFAWEAAASDRQRALHAQSENDRAACWSSATWLSAIRWLEAASNPSNGDQQKELKRF